MFTARCRLRRDVETAERTIGWDEGRLTGDPVAVEIVVDEAHEREGQAVGPEEGPFTFRLHLASGLSTVFLLREICIEEPEFAGDIPERPPIPEGAIG